MSEIPYFRSLHQKVHPFLTFFSAYVIKDFTVRWPHFHQTVAGDHVSSKIAASYSKMKCFVKQHPISRNFTTTRGAA